MDVSNAEIGSEYDEFPELEDRDFQKMARARVQKFGKMVMPASHPEVTQVMVELWIDGLATGLRMAREDGAAG